MEGCSKGCTKLSVKRVYKFQSGKKKSKATAISSSSLCIHFFDEGYD
jgi:hypothetical protein